MKKKRGIFLHDDGGRDASLKNDAKKKDNFFPTEKRL